MPAPKPPKDPLPTPEVERIVKELKQKRDKAIKSYDTRIKNLNKQIRAIQARCPHDHFDVSFDIDGALHQCTACGKEW